MTSRGQVQHIDFTDENIHALFGHEAAEDESPERLREYYFKSSIYDRVATSLPLRILVGHKGIGKSALFKVAMNEDRNANRLTLEVQPNDIVGLAEDTTDFLSTVRSWRNGLLELLGTKSITGLGGDPTEVTTNLKRYGGKLTDFLLNSIKDTKWIDADPTKKIIREAFLRNQEICVYIDDLDRGWQGRRQDINRISALLNAVRDISNENRNIRFRIALRSDVYFLVRTSDESTDKIESSVVWQSWTQQEIFALLIKRIETYFGNAVDLDRLLVSPQAHLDNSLEKVFETTFKGRGHWAGAPTHQVMMSLIRKRPRDLVKLCTLAARRAKVAGSGIITSQNLEDAFEDYSQGRLQDTINEFRTELPDLERLLLGMKPSKRERTAKLGYVYQTNKLMEKIRAIQEQGAFRFTGGRVANPKDLAAFMYKINFLTARRQDGERIDRKYFEESRYLQNSFADFGYDWEVHPAYRWALQPEDIKSIFESLRLSSL